MNNNIILQIRGNKFNNEIKILNVRYYQFRLNIQLFKLPENHVKRT